MTAKSVEALVEDFRLLGGHQHAIVQAVRALARQTIQPLTEEVKYGGVLFASGVHFGGVFAYKDHVSVEFGQGAAIDDTLGHLQGGGKLRRHLRLCVVDDIARKQLAVYLPLALRAAQAAGHRC